MGYITREEYLQQQQNNQSKKQSTGPKTLWNFRLKDDGDEAIVRFAYSDPSQFKLLAVHPGTAEDHFKKINCINDYKNGITDCPLCKAGAKLQQRFFVKLIEYVRNEDGTISAYPRIWDRPAKFQDNLINLFTEYGDISDCVFKVKRRGKAKDMQTEYDIMFGNPQVYNEQLYPKDFSAFENYDIIGTNVLNKSKAELDVIAREMTGFDNIKSDTLPFEGENKEPSITLASTPRKVVY